MIRVYLVHGDIKYAVHYSCTRKSQAWNRGEWFNSMGNQLYLAAMPINFWATFFDPQYSSLDAQWMLSGQQNQFWFGQQPPGHTVPAHFCFATFKYFSILQFFNKSLFLYLISNPLDDRKTKFLKTNLKVAKQKCVGTQCPGGCCPNQNWYCCPDNIHCASTVEYCGSKNVTSFDLHNNLQDIRCPHIFVL